MGQRAKSVVMAKIAGRFNKGPSVDHLGQVRLDGVRPGVGVRAVPRVPALTAGSEGGAVRAGGSGSPCAPRLGSRSARSTPAIPGGGNPGYPRNTGGRQPALRKA